MGLPSCWRGPENLVDLTLDNSAWAHERRNTDYSRDFWFKIVDFLQQNWALIEGEDPAGVVVWFMGDTGGVFDEIRFPSAEEAQDSLTRNGFKRYADDHEAQSFIRQPEPPFHRKAHPNGPIYSSGRYWR